MGSNLSVPPLPAVLFIIRTFCASHSGLELPAAKMSVFSLIWWALLQITHTACCEQLNGGTVFSLYPYTPLDPLKRGPVHLPQLKCYKQSIYWTVLTWQTDMFRVTWINKEHVSKKLTSIVYSCDRWVQVLSGAVVIPAMPYCLWTCCFTTVQCRSGAVTCTVAAMSGKSDIWDKKMMMQWRYVALNF